MRQTVSFLFFLPVLTAGSGVLLGCGSTSPGNAAPSITRFEARDDGVFVGERTQLTAVFSGERAEIDGLGPVSSGSPVETPALSATRTFTLTVHGAGQTAHAAVTVA